MALLPLRPQGEDPVPEAHPDKRLARAFREAGSAMAIVAPDGRLLDVNRAICQAVGLTEDQLLARAWEDILHPSELPEHRSRVEALISGRISGYTAEKRYAASGRGESWVRETVSLARDDRGEPLYFIVQLIDVTAGRRTAAALARSEERYRELAEHLPQTAVVTYDLNLRITLAAGSALADWGLDSRAVEGRSLAEVVPAPQLERLEPHYRAALAGETRSLEFAYADGRTFWLRTLPLRDDSGTTVGGMAVSADVTDRARAEARQRAAEGRFRGAFEHSGVGMALVGVHGPQADRLVEVNEALCKLTGYTRGRLLCMRFENLSHPDDTQAADEDLQRLLAGEESSLQAEQRIMDSKGRAVWALLSTSLVRDENGNPTHRILQLQDVSERKLFEVQLQHLADHDALTGLYNRRRFEEELSHELAEAARYGRHGAVMALDLDHFKYINDTLGHKVGDELIARVGSLLRERLRMTDTVARLGGDEFAVILPGVDATQARVVGTEMLAAIRDQGKLAGEHGRAGTTASVGIALFGQQPEGFTAEEILAAADTAMYDAKEAGRDRCALFAVDGRDACMAGRMTWVDRIRRALAEDRFVLHAQEIVSLDGDKRPRMELLLRMVDDHGDLIPPGSFLYVAERFDLIQQIDRWVVREAIEILARFEAAGMTVALEVNLSARSVSDPDMLGLIESELKRTGCDPAGLVFEMTETAAIVNVEKAKQFAVQLRRLGCEFALDDFGAGFASFYYLKHLAFDYLKIDGEFIEDLSHNPTNRLLVQALVQIARGMGKRTVAECVDGDETLDLLKEYGVELAQGFHLARPGPLNESRFAPKLQGAPS